jgi:hypothetical protein
MFGKAAADVLGLSDIGSVIKPEDFNKVDSDDYVMHEDGEKIFFLIKSKSDEYCFTNQALIHLDGTSAMSKKRLLKRYPYAHHMVGEVFLETAGTVDLDIEIKFTLGGNHYSIDVRKTFISELKDLYKALLKIAEIQHENQIAQQHGQQSLEVAVNTVGRMTKTEAVLVDQFKAVNQYAFEWRKQMRDQFVVRDFGFVFEKYINN